MKEYKLVHCKLEYLKRKNIKIIKKMNKKLGLGSGFIHIFFIGGGDVGMEPKPKFFGCECMS